MSKQSPIIEILKRYCDLLASTGTETVPHTGEVIWIGLGKQMEYARVCEQIQRLRAEASGWQPIETAPKDGRFLVWGGSWESELRKEAEPETINLVNRHGELFGIVGGEHYSSWINDPTHWMPLPEPPKAETKE